MDGWTDGWMNGWTGGWIICLHVSMHASNAWTYVCTKVSRYVCMYTVYMYGCKDVVMYEGIYLILYVCMCVGDGTF